MATKREELLNPSGCLNQAADDEPIFVLRANDELAPDTVREWAAEYSYNKSLAKRGGMTDAQRAKYNEAIKLAIQMDEWRKVRT